MINKQQGIAPLAMILIIIAILVIGGGVYYYTNQPVDIQPEGQEVVQNEQETTQLNQEVVNEDQETAQTEQQVANDFKVEDKEEKIKIQNLLNKQCQALSSKDLGLLVSTIDQSNTVMFQEYKQSAEILLSMTDSVTKCQYEIQSVQFVEDTGGLIAETTEKGDLRIKLIGGSIKTIEDPNTLNTGKYVLSENGWKQIISTKN